MCVFEGYRLLGTGDSLELLYSSSELLADAFSSPSPPPFANIPFLLEFSVQSDGLAVLKHVKDKLHVYQYIEHMHILYNIDEVLRLVQVNDKLKSPYHLFTNTRVCKNRTRHKIRY